MTQVTKRVVAILATMMLLISMAIPVAAAPSQPNTGSITVHKIARATAGIAHPNNIYSGEALSSTEVATLGTPLNGAGFTLYAINAANLNTELALGRTVTGYTVSGTNVIYTFASGLPATVTCPSTLVGVEQMTAGVAPNAGQATWAGPLDDGYYLLVETTNPDPAKYTPAKPCVIRLPLTLNDGSGENRDIHVYPKNIDNDVKIVNKEVKGGLKPIATDDLVPFEINTLFKNQETGLDAVDSVSDLKKGSNYGSVVIKDVLKTYFTYVDGTTAGAANLAVYLYDAVNTQVGTLTPVTDYTVGGTVGAAGTTVTVTLTTAGIDKAVLANASSMSVEFWARYTGGASGASGTNVTTIENTAEGSVKAAIDPSGPITPTPGPTATPPVITPIPVYIPKTVIEVTKTKEDGVAPLAGTVFAITTTATPTFNYDPSATYATAAALTAGGYVVDLATSTAGNFKAITATSDGSGKFVINDMPYVAAGVKYYLKELVTVAGYELPIATFEIDFPAQASLDPALFEDVAKTIWKNGAVIKVTASIKNELQGTTKTFSLPLTGGTGTMIFTIAGIVLMAGAVVIFLRGRKKSEE